MEGGGEYGVGRGDGGRKKGLRNVRRRRTESVIGKYNQVHVSS